VTRVALGVVDDCALWAPTPGMQLAVSGDLLVEGRHFLSTVPPQALGHKALAVNLSDLAAMAARPVAAVVALLLPRHGGLHLAQEIYEGMLPLAERFDLSIAGGDTNSWDRDLVVAVTAIGETTDRGPLTRAGARPGDRVIVTGQFGGSILGRHLDVEPRVNEALLLHERYTLHAGIDCSDGLSLDLWRMSNESNCGAVIDSDRVPIAATAMGLHEMKNIQQDSSGLNPETPLDHALCDGEDFELILAVPPAEAALLIAEQPLAGVALTDIGEFVTERGLWQRNSVGQTTQLAPTGWEHELG
jgi:thiamine-monophosphate kinase